MAEETDLSRTEPPTARRLRDARRRGDVPRSAEWSGWVALLAAFALLGGTAPRLFDALRVLLQTTLTNAARPLASAQGEPVLAVLWAVLPFLAATFAVALLAPLLLSGWVYAPAAVRADFSRASPLAPLLRLASADAWFDGSLVLLKLVLAAVALAWSVSGDWQAWSTLEAADPAEALPVAADWIGRGLIALAVALAVVAMLDAAWRWWRYLRRHAMTWQEVLAEARESEPDPEVRARMRARQQQAGIRPVTASPPSSPEGTSRQATRPAGGQIAAHPAAGEGANARPRPDNGGNG